jgi:hypothetical protein
MKAAAANVIVNIRIETSDKDSEDAQDGGSATDPASGGVDS